jgi:micrococcal nuclease
VLALLAIVTGAAGIPYFIASDEAQRPPLDAQPTQLTLPQGYTLESLQRAEVEEIIDGDTIDVRLDGREQRVRYFGVDTPERGDRCYREATDRNEQLLGKMVLLLPDARTQDDNGRLLRYVFLEDGTSLDATLVAEGFGWAWTQDGRYRDQIVALEDAAESAGRGCLWK